MLASGYTTPSFRAAKLPSDTSAIRAFVVSYNRRDFKPDSLELWFVIRPFQPPRVWGAHF
jgi:hypothetical protein